MMNTVPEAAPIRDAGQMSDVERRLMREFSGVVPPDEVSRCVTRVAAGFDEARVRVFVPVLVERVARQWLRDAVRESSERPTLVVVPNE
jgi:hypothetical protein